MPSPPPRTDNEETEGSDVPTDYLLGDVEGEDGRLYLLDPEHAHCKWERAEGVGWGWERGPGLPTLPASVSQRARYVLPLGGLPVAPRDCGHPTRAEHLQDKAGLSPVSGSEADAAS